MEPLHKKAVKILNARIGLASNRKELLPTLPLHRNSIDSLLTDYHSVEEFPFRNGLDGYIVVKDSDKALTYRFTPDRIFFEGRFLQMVRKASDLRYTLWGNQGFLYRYTLYLLEKVHKIYSFHACALFNEESKALYVILGGAGSGKTVFLLSGLTKGLKLFSTETVSFKMAKSHPIWLKGSFVDNVRLGTLVENFPQFLPAIELLPVEELWQKKIAVDLASHQLKEDSLEDIDRIHILLPRVEQGRKRTIWNPIRNETQAAKILFDNISQKIAETVLLYDSIPVPGFDNSFLASLRLKNVNQLARHRSIVQIVSVVTNPTQCWEHIIQ